MQITKPRARPITSYRGEPDQFMYWRVSGSGIELNGVDLDKTVNRWYATQIEQQTDTDFVFVPSP
jgi:hypothetical protein